MMLYAQCHEIEMSVYGAKSRDTKDTERTINLLLSYVQLHLHTVFPIIEAPSFYWNSVRPPSLYWSP